MPPNALMQSLESLRKRVKLLSVGYGVGLLALGLVGTIVLLVLLDYALNLPALPRVGLTLAGLVGLAIIAFRRVVSPGMARFALRDVAAHVERVFPQFDDRLRSTVDFLSGQKTGSESLQQQVILQTSQMAKDIDFTRAIESRPVVYSLGGGAGAILALLLLATLVVGPQFRDIALSRLFNPFGGKAWPKNTQIQMVVDVPSRVAVGQKLDLRMRLSKGDKSSAKAIVEYQYGNFNSAGEFVGTPIQQEYMLRSGQGIYGVSLDARADTNEQASILRVTIKSGDDEVRLKDITILPRIAVRSAIATVTLPRYVGGDAVANATFDLAKSPALMPTGSVVKLDLTFNKSLALGDADIRFESVESSAKLPAPRELKIQGSSANVTWAMEQSSRFRIIATDTDGFTSSGLEEYEILVRPDQLPAIQIESPRRSEDRTPVAIIPLQAAAEDDYGVASVKLIVTRLSDKKIWTIPLVDAAKPQADANWLRVDASGDHLRYRLNWFWDLAKLNEANLKSGDVLEYFLQAQDNYEIDGKRHEPVSSGRLRITIISQEELTAKVVDELRQIKERINDVRLNQDRTLNETQQLSADTKDKPNLDNADKAALDRLSNQQATAATQSRQLAGKLEQLQGKLDENKSPAQDLKDLARDVKDDLNRAAEEPMKNAGNDLTGAKDTPKPEDRNTKLTDAQDNQGKASDQLKRAMDRMENIGTLRQAIDRIGEILKQQQDLTQQTQDVAKNNLGKKPEEMNAEDRKKLEDLGNKQQELSDKTAKELANLQKTSEQLSKADPNAADAMKQAANTGQQQQVPGNQSKAAQNAKQNKQAETQSAQKQAEIGLQVMLNQLKEAERRKLAELQKQLAELDVQVKTLLRRQAQHNLDNVTLQGEDKLKKLDAKTLEQLNTLSQRDPKAKVEVDLARLNGAQELTERNTRDIARKAEETQGAGEVASQLVRAAGKMERAIVFLRDNKLPDAYEPPQVEALAALLEASAKVEQMKKDADAKADQEKKEVIRQAYIAIKTDQEKVNVDTQGIDKSRQPDGSLKRPDAVRLGQMPGEQQKLVDRMKKLDESIAALGSVVYTWANKDIIDSMGDVKRALGKQNTGSATQGEQQRIVDQLQAMIDNLAEKPIESKFAQDAGGGGSGSGSQQKKLPTEAELRLVRAFQEGVNKGTIEVDKAANKDKERLLDLGTRQGQYRELLGNLLEQSSHGQITFGKEPDNRDQLPEEAKQEDLENKETDDALLNDKPDVDAGERQANLIGNRMARSRQRLALNGDPGKVTQLIQKKILDDLDALIEQARKQQAQARNSDQQSKAGEKQQNQPAEANQQANQKPNQRSGNPAQDSTPNAGPAANPANKPGTDIRENAAEWGKLTPRVRDAVLDSKDETIIESYRKLVEDYYKSLSTKAGQGQ
jgi:hypothetical protein